MSLWGFRHICQQRIYNLSYYSFVAQRIQMSRRGSLAHPKLLDQGKNVFFIIMENGILKNLVY
jgi:hypothetical protein